MIKKGYDKYFSILNNIKNQVYEYAFDVCFETNTEIQNHLGNVRRCVENILDDNINVKLSSIDKFILEIAPFLHEYAFVPTRYELALFRLIDDSKKENEIFTRKEAKELILNNYTIFDRVFINSSFLPKIKSVVVDYLAEMLLDYQKFCQKYVLESDSCMDLFEKNNLNKI